MSSVRCAFEISWRSYWASVNQIASRSSSVAGKAEIAKSYWAKLERGEVNNPGIMTLSNVAEALGTTMRHLLAETTSSHKRPRWSAVINPAEIEHLRASMPKAFSDCLATIEAAEGHVSADVIRSLAFVQVGGKRPASASDWLFLYEAMKRSVSVAVRKRVEPVYQAEAREE